jgi:hypothetical protein
VTNDILHGLAEAVALILFVVAVLAVAGAFQ